jgi:hypothetical protein
MTVDTEHCYKFNVYSILVENVLGIAAEASLVTANLRHSALFHASATILAAILKSGSVT